MKQRVFALVLALCMVLTALPGFTFPAAEPMMTPNARPVQPQAEAYSVTLTYTGPGVAELYAASAGARESVYFLADPEPGYRVSFDKCGYYMEQHKMELYYIGSNVYEIVMPDGDVMLDLEFVAIESDPHDVTVTVNEGGLVSVDQTSAKQGESLFVEVLTVPGYTLESVKARSGGEWLPGYYLGKVDGAELYEVFMPDSELEILVTFTRNGPYTITARIDSDPAGGTVELSHETAYELEAITITATPDRGWQVASVDCYHAQVTQISENIWIFPMPRFNEEVHVTFAPIVYTVSAAVETGLGGSVSLDRETATIGEIVTLTCTPDAGYRVARITGAEVTDNGDGTYSFLMPDADMELCVLFLRENNPFLDVNETQYFHDPILWAVEAGITNGIDPTHFGPMGVCNRAQVVTFLWRAAGSPAPTSRDNPFEDVAEGVWYSDAVLWAVEMGITTGIDATHFGPNNVCSRAQAVTFLYRANGSPKVNSAENPFADVAEDSFYRNPVLWALENSITTGTSADTFTPGGECLRAQVVTFLYRADRIEKPQLQPFPEVG